MKCRILEFLQSCQDSNGIPRFLQLKVTYRYLQSSSGYKSCQKRLSKGKISFKKNKINQFSLQLKKVRKHIEINISFFLFQSHIHVFLISKMKHLVIRMKKIVIQFLKPHTYDPKKVILILLIIRLVLMKIIILWKFKYSQIMSYLLNYYLRILTELYFLMKTIIA